MMTATEDRKIHVETTERHLIRSILALAGNRFVGVTFLKIDGSIRKMTCRVTEDDPTMKYMTVFDVRVRGYRRINLDCVMSVRLAGVELKVA